MAEAIPIPAPDVKVETIEGEVLLYHPRNTRAIYLNATAAVIWGLCDGRRCVREIVAMIEESYPDAGNGLAEDVLATLAQLRDNGVLLAEPSSS